MGNEYSESNRSEREHLRKVVSALSEADYGRGVGEHGWRVGGILAHLAFWDLRASALLDRWKHSAIGPSAVDIDAVNDAMRDLCNAVPPHAVADLVLSSAASIDAALDALEPDFLARIEAEGKPVRLDRAAHRKHHLAQIEAALGR